MQSQIPLYNKAATFIKQCWHEYKRKQVVEYYGSLFQRNQSTFFQEEVSGIFAEHHHGDDMDYENVASCHDNSFAEERE